MFERSLRVQKSKQEGFSRQGNRSQDLGFRVLRVRTGNSPGTFLPRSGWYESCRSSFALSLEVPEGPSDLTGREGTSNIGTNSGSYTEPSDPIETLNLKPKP